MRFNERVTIRRFFCVMSGSLITFRLKTSSLPVASFHGYRETPPLLSHPRRSDVTPARRQEEPSRHAQSRDDSACVSTRAASELVALRWSDVELERGTIYCRRAKGSRSSVHPLKRDEAAALEKLLAQRRQRAG